MTIWNQKMLPVENCGVCNFPFTSVTLTVRIIWVAVSASRVPLTNIVPVRLLISKHFCKIYVKQCHYRCDIIAEPINYKWRYPISELANRLPFVLCACCLNRFEIGLVNDFSDSNMTDFETDWLELVQVQIIEYSPYTRNTSSYSLP